MTTVDTPAKETSKLSPTIKLRSGLEIEAVGETIPLWAKLARLDLRQANFQARTYDKLLLAGIDLTSAVCTDTDLSGCDLTGAVMTSLIGERVNLAGSILTGATLESAGIVEADLTGATVTAVTARFLQAVGAAFNEAVFSGGYFGGCQFDSASFKEAAFKKTRFIDDCVLSNTVFDGAVLEDVEFTQANLNHASFISAELKNCRFATTDLSNADFTGADLKGTKLSNCVFTGIILKDTKNIPQNIDKCGSTKVVEVLVRRAIALGNKSGLLSAAFSKLWFQHLVSGGDLMLEPFEDVMDAALALADAMESQHGGTRARR